MISDIQCTPTEIKDYFDLKFKTRDGKVFQDIVEKSEVRHIIEKLDNAI